MMDDSQRLTVAQALVKFLLAQHVERDGVTRPFFAGCFGIFGHGNLAGIGQALQQYPGLRYYQARNEQAMVHTAAAYAKTTNRLQTLACTTSVGPGATNLVSGAAAATINRLPVLLLPGDTFARRNVAPVLQQLESERTQDTSVNDCLLPVSRYWDRINRPDQLITSLPEAMRVLTSPSETGAVTLALPQDVQTEAYAFPQNLFQERVWTIARSRPDRVLLDRAAQLIRSSKRPLIIAGGGVRYSEAAAALASLVEQTGIPVAETMAGKGSLRYDHLQNLGAIGVTGTPSANACARSADLVIAIGTRLSDFTTSSKTGFQDPDVRFISVNVSPFDAAKHASLQLVGDARETVEELNALLHDFHVEEAYEKEIRQLHSSWHTEVERVYAARHAPLPGQPEIIGAVNNHGSPESIMVCAAGSLPGDLHKLWRSRHPAQFHLEYGYSCMGYEIAGGLGVRMAAPDRDVYVLVGDGSYLMMSTEIITSIQEGYKLTIVLFDNDGYKSIGSLSRSLGQGGFGTRYGYPVENELPGDEQESIRRLPVNLADNARSIGAYVIECRSYDDVVEALGNARDIDHTVVIYVQTDRYIDAPDSESWWDVPVAEVSDQEEVQHARKEWEARRLTERYFV